MGVLFSSSNNSNHISPKSKTIHSKEDRQILTKTFNFDNQNISNLSNFEKIISSNKIISVNMLTAESNKLSSLPDDCFFKLASLKRIILKKNLFDKIPTSIIKSNCSKTIKFLDMSFNQITSIDDEFGKCLLQLSEVVLSNNLLNSIPNSLENLRKLRKIDFSYNRFELFPCFLLGISSIEEINISNNQIINYYQLDSDRKISDSLLSLNISNNKLKIVPSFILINSNISMLNLKVNLIKLSQLKETIGYENFLNRRKYLKNKGFDGNLDIDFDICGLSNE